MAGRKAARMGSRSVASKAEHSAATMAERLDVMRAVWKVPKKAVPKAHHLAGSMAVSSAAWWVPARAVMKVARSEQS